MPNRLRLLRAAIGAVAVGVLGSLVRSLIEAVTGEGRGPGDRSEERTGRFKAPPDPAQRT